nr:hypothetical protein [Candidatus Sigynarchaeota archaeon]
MKHNNLKVAVVAIIAVSCILPAIANCAVAQVTRDDSNGDATSIHLRADYYSFSVLNETVEVFVENDGSITIKYWIKFRNDYSAELLDVADIGFPNQYYRLDSVNASITDGGTAYYPLTRIGRSSVIPIGVEVWFDGHELSYNQVETLYVECNNPQMIYEDTENASMASLEFVPTWFDSQSAGDYIYNYNLTFYFPANYLNGSQLKWHEKLDDPYWKVPEYGYKNFTSPIEQRLFYEWNYTSITQTAHQFGASFPRAWIAEGAVQPTPVDPMLVVGVWICIFVFAGVVVLVSILYLYAKYQKKIKTQYYPPVRKTASPFGGLCCCGVIVLLIVVFVFIEDIYYLLFFGSIALVVLAFVFVAYFLAKAIDKRRLKYEKPKLSIECVGVNKNLTVPEAAIIKNTPLGKVIFLMFFGMMRKDLVNIKQDKPLLLEKKQNIFPANLRLLAEESRKVRDYELDIFEAIGPTGAFSEPVLKEALIRMIKRTHAKMVGFDLKATIAYHDNLMVKAWNQVKSSSGDIKFDDIASQFEYMVLDDEFAKKAPTYLGTRTVWMPYWYSSPYRYWHPVTPTTGISTGGLPSSFGTPGNLGAINAVDFANSISTGLSNISNNIATNVSNFFNSITSAVSPPPPKPSGGGGSSSGGRSYSGGSCACACACACAGCACACAGGGR